MFAEEVKRSLDRTEFFPTCSLKENTSSKTTMYDLFRGQRVKTFGVSE